MFKIAGTTVAEPKLSGLAVTDEPIWASNTGRNAKGKMIGDIVAWKTTVEVAWPPLSYADACQIRNAIKSGGEFFNIQYKDIEEGSSLGTVTKTVYCGNIPRVLYSLNSKARLYDGITIQFIEQ